MIILPELLIVIFLAAPDDVNVTPELLLIVRLFIVGLVFMEIEELELIITSSELVGAPDGDQFELVPHELFPPTQVLVTP